MSEKVKKGAVRARVEKFFDDLEEEKFIGKIILELHYVNGGIADAYRDVKRERI